MSLEFMGFRNTKPFIVVLLVAASAVAHYDGGWAPRRTIPEEQVPREAFRVVTGPIEDDSAEESQNRDNLWPWRHYIDFNERFPGQDQIALESSRGSSDNGLSDTLAFPDETSAEMHPSLNQDRDRHSRRLSFPSLEDQEPDEANNDDLIVPNFAQMFSLGPQIGETQPNGMSNLNPRPFEIPQFSNYLQHWQNILGLSKKEPWWKGSNVCIKREEEEEPQNEEGSESSSNSSEPRETLQLFFSACDDLDMRHQCLTRQVGQGMAKTIKTIYECCPGYILNELKTTCIKGRYENLIKTIQDIGGTEFIRLIKMAGLESKLDKENLTIFLPKNEALIDYIRSHNLESNSIQFIPQLPEPEKLIRTRRSILMHSKNEPGGRNVRRRGGETKGRREDNEDFFKADSSSSEENDDLVSISSQPKRQKINMSKRNGLDLDDDDDLQRVDNNFGLYYGLEGSQGELQQMLLNQMIEGSISTDDFVDEKVLYSENKADGNSEKSVIRFNTWDIDPQGRVNTVNCVPFVSINHKCTNGVVHVLDKVLQPVTQNIVQILAADPELSQFHSLLNSGGLLPMLEDINGHFTLFAPNNKAMERIEPELLARMRNGDSCLKKILRHHILPITFCSSIVDQLDNKGQLRTVDSDLLDIEKISEQKILINGSEFLKKDLVATNGVVHVINGAIISENDRMMTDILRRDGEFSMFLTLLQRAEINLDEMENITVFAPNNAALTSELTVDIMANPRRLREVMMYHITKPESRVCTFQDDQRLNTLLPGKSIGINIFSSWPFGFSYEITAQCGKLLRTNRKGCNGVFHEIDRIILPPNLDLIETLRASSSKFSMFTQLLTEHEASLWMLQSGNESFTIFAPTNEAFNSLTRDEHNRLMNNKSHAFNVIKRHIVKESLCCTGMITSEDEVWKNVKTVDDSNSYVPVFKDTLGKIHFGGGYVTSCDLMATNGIIQTVDKVLIYEMEQGSRMFSPSDFRSLFFRF